MAVDYEKYFNEYMKEIEDRIRKELVKKVFESYEEYFNLLKKRITDMYKETIDEFYNDYEPKEFEYKDSNGNKMTYQYKRRGSLYNLLNIALTKKPDGGSDMDIDFNPSKIVSRTGYNEEDGLYDTVFRHGWHGGARHNDSFYWKTPVPTFKFWGAEAKQANISPLESFRKKFNEYEQYQSNKIFNDILYKKIQTINISW